MNVIYTFRIVIAVACFLVMVTACTSLPDTQFLKERYVAQTISFSDAWGPISEKRSAATLEELKRKSDANSILDRHIALEQDIVGTPLVMGNKVSLLQDGPATYQAMFAAINKATDHINLESFTIEENDIGQQFADLLIERQAKGVQVNLIYDSYGTLATSKSFFDRLKQAGVQVVEFNPINPSLIKKSWELNKRDHRKLLIIDGQTAFLGGINISNAYSTGSSIRNHKKTADQTTGWRDTDIQIEGPVVAEFQKLFIQTWYKQKGPALAQKNYFPKIALQGKEIVRAIGSTPDDSYSLIYLTLISAITNAEKQVYITNAYFVPDPQLIKALLDAAGRDVDVRLILPSHSDSSIAFHAGRSHYSELLKGGVKIYERQGTVLHAKTALIDSIWSCVGSSNLDWRSATDNDEINAVILGYDFAEQMEAVYFQDIADSNTIELEKWEHRSVLSRLKETMARLLGRFV